MMRLELPRPKNGPLRILCLGAHADDIEIGCGGTLLHLAESHAPVRADWVVFSGTAVRAREARASARRLLGRSLGRLETKRFRDGFFPYQAARIKEEFERLKRRRAPDLVFCPWRDDAHQDHRLLAELTWNTFRDHLILEYEIPKWDGDLGSPNCYVRIPDDLADLKVRSICETFATQRTKAWFTPDTFRALMRLRGVESNAQYAEAFHARKLALG
jgi:LmbE family N-acetylglucosaminyl deacetylase